jgi:hypothetical protein
MDYAQIITIHRPAAGYLPSRHTKSGKIQIAQISIKKNFAYFLIYLPGKYSDSRLVAKMQ